MYTKHTASSGFTLIELLVVIAVIGLLSSIVFASLNSARNKANDAAIKSEVLQIQILMEENASDNNGSYANLQYNGWIPLNVSCAGLFTGTYGAQEQRLCQHIVTEAGTCSGNTCVLIGNSPGMGAFVPTKYSINAYLPGVSSQTGVAHWFCAGSSGTNITTTFNDPGCFYNP